MKKITSILLGAVSALCFFAGAAVASDTEVAYAEESTASVVLSETKYKVSDDSTKMLLVTAIQNVETVYEVGYEFSEGYLMGKNAVAEKTKYYESITTNVKQTAEDIFGAEYADAKLIIWEVAYGKGMTFNAYAKQGVIENGQLTMPNEEIKVVNTTKAGPALTEKEQAGITAIVGGHIKVYHGQARSIKASGNNVAVVATSNSSNFRGFGLQASAAKTMLDLGYKYMEFTITSDAPFVDIYNSITTDIVVNSSDASFISASKNMYFANGTRITLDLQAIYKDNAAVNFILCSSAAWTEYAQDGSMIFTNVQFVEKPSVTAFTSSNGIFSNYGEAVNVTAGETTNTDTTATMTYTMTVAAGTYTFISFDSVLINEMMAKGYTKATITVALPSARYINSELNGTGLTTETRAYGSVASVGFSEFALTADGSYNLRFYFGETTEVTVSLAFSK